MGQWTREMHGGMNTYRGSPVTARACVEADRSRAGDFYLAEGTGPARRFGATPDRVREDETMDGDTYERWVAGVEVETGLAKGRLRDDEHAVRFVEVTVNGPKTWSLAAARHPMIAEPTTLPRIERHWRLWVGWPSTTPPEPGIRTVIRICRSTPGSRQPAAGGGCTPSAYATASMRPTASATRP